MATKLDSTLPSPAEVTNWNRQAQKPAKTYTRAIYNYCSKWEKFICVLRAGNPAAAAFLAFGVPLAKETGSKIIERATVITTEVVSAVTNPAGWVAGKAAHEAGKILIKGIQEGIKHPQTKRLLQKKLSDTDAEALLNELADVADIGVSLLANKAAIPLEQALSACVQQHSQITVTTENRKRKLNETAEQVSNVTKRIKEDQRVDEGYAKSDILKGKLVKFEPCLYPVNQQYSLS